MEPKRRNLKKTKARILDAAANIFAASGYAQASLRDIAVQADIAPSLISRYFGTKAALFEEALVYVLNNNTVFTWDKDNFGEVMADLIAERNSIDISVMLVLALADPEAKEIARRVSRKYMIEPLAEWLGPPHALERAMNLFSVTTGFAIEMSGLNSAPPPVHSLKWLAVTLQGIVDEK